MVNEIDLLMSGHQYKKLFEKKYEDMMKKYDLRKVEIEILYYIANCAEHDTAKDIASLQYISKAYISNSIERLTGKKYITVAEDGMDRRYSHIQITKTALPVIEEIKSIREEILSIIFKGISREDMDTMLCLSGQMVRNMSDELKK